MRLEVVLWDKLPSTKSSLRSLVLVNRLAATDLKITLSVCALVFRGLPLPSLWSTCPSSMNWRRTRETVVWSASTSRPISLYVLLFPCKLIILNLFAWVRRGLLRLTSPNSSPRDSGTRISPSRMASGGAGAGVPKSRKRYQLNYSFKAEMYVYSIP